MTNKPRFTLTFPDEMLSAVDEYQKENGISTRSKAIQELVMAGIINTQNNNAPAPKFVDAEANEIVNAYLQFQTVGEKNIVRRALNLSAIGETNEDQIKDKVIPLFPTAAAAGKGEIDTELPWEDYEVPADSKAEFAVRISGDSMEPLLNDGQIVLCTKERPDIGDVAIVMVNGALLVKQFITDGRNVYLRSINRKRKDCDYDIWESGNDTVICYGTVILKKRPPLVDQ